MTMLQSIRATVNQAMLGMNASKLKIWFASRLESYEPHMQWKIVQEIAPLDGFDVNVAVIYLAEEIVALREQIEILRSENGKI